MQVDIEDDEKSYAYLKCNYYGKVVKGCVIGMKEHLLVSHKNVAHRVKVLEEVKEENRVYMKKEQ